MEFDDNSNKAPIAALQLQASNPSTSPGSHSLRRSRRVSEITRAAVGGEQPATAAPHRSVGSTRTSARLLRPCSPLVKVEETTESPDDEPSCKKRKLLNDGPRRKSGARPAMGANAQEGELLSEDNTASQRTQLQEMLDATLRQLLLPAIATQAQQEQRLGELSSAVSMHTTLLTDINNKLDELTKTGPFSPLKKQQPQDSGAHQPKTLESCSDAHEDRSLDADEEQPKDEPSEMPLHAEPDAEGLDSNSLPEANTRQDCEKWHLNTISEVFRIALKRDSKDEARSVLHTLFANDDRLATFCRGQDPSLDQSWNSAIQSFFDEFWKAGDIIKFKEGR